MSNRHSVRHPSAPRRLLPALLVALVAGAAALPAPAADRGAEARYRHDRAVCLDGASQQDTATCLKEAGAARQASRAGALGDADAGRDGYTANALARCEPLPDAERADCVDRMLGDGTRSGSVAGGGILRELETIVVIVPERAPGLPDQPQ